MKTLKIILRVGLAVAVGCAVVSLWVVRRESLHPAALQRGASEHPAAAQPPVNQSEPVEPALMQIADPVPVEEPAPAEEAIPASAPPEAVASAVLPAKKAAKTAAAPNPARRGSKPPPRDPLARDALFLAGVDPDAEQYWALAINDPSLPPNERQDLIEDLNEEGFPDPRNLTADDLPLILSRIALIEQHVGDAMDEVNAAAFMEAYKDLWNMLARASQW